MFKLFAFILSLLSVLNSCNQINADTTEYKIVIDTITKGGVSEWYKIHEQFISKPCKNTINYGSTYLCTKNNSRDTVLIVSPCIQNEFKKNSSAALFIDENVKLGDTVVINIPKQYDIFLKRRKLVVFGTLKIPKQ